VEEKSCIDGRWLMVLDIKNKVALLKYSSVFGGVTREFDTNGKPVNPKRP